MCILFASPVFSIFFCSRWWWLFRSDQQWAALRKKKAHSENWAVCSKTSQCSSCLSCQEATATCVGAFPTLLHATLEDEQRCWPWSSSKKSVLISSVQCDNCFWGAVLKAAVMCAVERWHRTPCFLYPESLQSRVHQVQLITSGIHLASFVEMFSQAAWLLCGALSNEDNQCTSSVLLPLLWPLPTVLVHGYERTCHAAYVPVSAEVYMCSLPLLLKVYREKLDCPGQLRQPNSS